MWLNKGTGRTVVAVDTRPVHSTLFRRGGFTHHREIPLKFPICHSSAGGGWTISTLSTLESIICRGRWGASEPALASRAVTCILSRVVMDEQVAGLAGSSFRPLVYRSSHADGGTLPMRTLKVWTLAEGPSTFERLRYSVAEALAEFPAVNLPLRRCFIGLRQHPLPAHIQVTALYSVCLERFRIAAMTARLMNSGRTIPTTSNWVYSVLEGNWQTAPSMFNRCKRSVWVRRKMNTEYPRSSPCSAQTFLLPVYGVCPTIWNSGSY